MFERKKKLRCMTAAFAIFFLYGTITQKINAAIWFVGNIKTVQQIKKKIDENKWNICY